MNRTSHLIQCEVGGGPGEPACESGTALSTRFVEQSLFELWRYRLERVHQLTVQNLRPCIWMKIAQAHNWPDHMASRTNVIRAVFSKLDQDTGTELKQARYFEQRHYNRLKLLVGGQIFDEIPGAPKVTLDMGVVISQPS